MSVSFTRVAKQWLQASSNLLMLIERAVPANNIDSRDILEELQDALKAHLLKSLGDIKVVKTGSRKREWNAWEHEGSSYQKIYYHAEVEFPTSITIAQETVIPLGSIWAKVLQNLRLPPIKMPPTLPSFISELLEESFFGQEFLSKSEEQSIEDQLFSIPTRGIHTEASVTITNEYGEEESDGEAWNVDARFSYKPVFQQIKLSTKVLGDDVMVQVAIPVQIEFRRLVSPWSHDYRG